MMAATATDMQRDAILYILPSRAPDLPSACVTAQVCQSVWTAASRNSAALHIYRAIDLRLHGMTDFRDRSHLL